MPFGHSFRVNDSWDEGPGASSGALDPTVFTIASLEFLYDANNIVGSPFTEWPDTSGNNQTWTGIAPSNNITQDIGGIPARGKGAAGAANLSTIAPNFDGQTGVSMYCTGYYASAGSSVGFFLATEGVKMSGAASDNIRVDVTSDTTSTFTQTNTGVSFGNHFFIGELIVDLTLGSDDIKFYNHEFNISTGAFISTNVALATLAGTTISSPTNGLAYKRDFDGGAGGTGNSGQPARIGQMIGFSSALTLSERQLVLDYLQDALGCTGLTAS